MLKTGYATGLFAAGAALEVDDTFHTAHLRQMGPVTVVRQFIRNSDALHFSYLIIPKRHLSLSLVNNRETMEMGIRRLANPDQSGILCHAPEVTLATEAVE